MVDVRVAPVQVFTCKKCKRPFRAHEKKEICPDCQRLIDLGLETWSS